MDDRVGGALSLPDDWPAHPDLSLALNRMGSFDWDLDTGLMHMDRPALEVFDLRDEEYDNRPDSIAVRMPPDEGVRLDAMVAQALKSGQRNYGAYFRILRRDGTLRWTHTQGFIQRDGSGRPHRIIGIVRDATQELADSTARREPPSSGGSNIRWAPSNWIPVRRFCSSPTGWWRCPAPISTRASSC